MYLVLAIPLDIEHSIVFLNVFTMPKTRISGAPTGLKIQSDITRENSKENSCTNVHKL